MTKRTNTDPGGSNDGEFYWSRNWFDFWSNINWFLSTRKPWRQCPSPASSRRRVTASIQPSMLRQNPKTMKANLCSASLKQLSTSPPHASLGSIRRLTKSRKDSSPRRESCCWTTTSTWWAQIWGNCARDSKSCKSWERIRRNFFKLISIAFCRLFPFPPRSHFSSVLGRHSPTQNVLSLVA